MSGTTITSSGTAALQLAAAGPSPVTVAAGVSIVLSGSVTADNSLASAAYGGVGAGWTLLNEGTLAANLTLASGAAVGAGLRFAGPGSVTNGLAGLLQGNEEGLALAGGSAVNRGTISGGMGANSTGLGRVGVQLGGGTLENSGLVEGGAYGASLNAAAQVTNNGQISGGVAGVMLATGGSLANVAGATITGGAAGVVLQAGAARLANAGSIAATLSGDGHEGVVLAGGAYLANTGSISGFDGVFDNSGTVTLVNGGLIESGGTLGLFFPATGYSFVSGAAVELTSASVTNFGVIRGNDVPVNEAMQAGSAGSGLIMGAGTLNNIGTIAGGGGADATHGGVGLAGAAQLAGYNNGLIAGGTGTYGGSGVLLSGGSLLNAGTVLGGDGVVSGGNGVVLTNGATLVNQGQIAGGIGQQYLWNVGLGAGVALYNGVLENTGRLSGGGQQLMGLWMGGGQAVNTGTIAGHSALAMQGGTIENMGLISGTAIGVDLAGGSFLNAGTLAGSYAVYMAVAGAQLGVAAGAVFEGKVADHAGNATLLLTGAVAGTLDMGTSFSGFGDISFAAGADWVLAGGAAQLTGGERIDGFQGSDTLLLEGFTATSESFVSGTGLVLGAGSANVTLDVAANDPAFIVSDVAQGTQIVICYRRGTMIQTMRGEQDVALLRIGDTLPTRFGGVRRIKWIGRQSYTPKDVWGNRERIPVCIQPGALGQGLPHRALYVSPGHSMLLGGVLVLARALVNGVTITQNDDGTGVEYFLPEFETHDCLLAEGAWSESFADGPGLRRQFHNRAEFHALCKAYREPGEITLCAPRPLRGVALEAALRPVLAWAAAAPGVLRGCVDVADGWRIEGWAQDITWPEFPQRLEFYVGRRKLGDALACHFREDLAKAGISAGRAAFSFLAPRRFKPENLFVRRAQDGAEIYAAIRRAA